MLKKIYTDLLHDLILILISNHTLYFRLNENQSALEVSKLTLYLITFKVCSPEV